MFDLSKKEYNTYLLLNLISSYGSISRTQLCDITELRAATISDITKELIEKGIIKEEGSTNSGRGRNQILLRINNDYLCAIGVSIEVNDITFVVSTLQGSILKKVVKDIIPLKKAEQITNLITDVLRDLIEEFKQKRILGIGVGDPGVVDIKGEYSIFSSQLRLWENIPLKSILENSLNLPVRLEVNERLKAVGERKYGLAKGIDDFICLQLGEGIGISMISNGTLIRGYNGTAGELGHTRIENNNNICMCGSYGCLETIASLTAIISQIKDAIKQGAMSLLQDIYKNLDDITKEDIKKALSLKDKLCLNIVEKAGNYIGISLSNVINIINPKLIILDGDMCEFGDAVISPIKSAVYRNSLTLATSDLEFKVSELKELSAPLGAITMIIDEFFMTRYFEKIYHKNGSQNAENNHSLL